MIGTERVVIFETMGTVVSLTGPALPAGARERLIEICSAYDARFSLYRDDSELSQLNDRRVLLTRASDELRQAYVLADEWRAATDNAFTAHRPDGVIDLSGVVKALAIRDCGAALTDMGCRDWCLNVGGDVLVSGYEDPAAAKPWIVGIVDPADRAALLSQFTASAEYPAVCTSGTSERGEHVWRLGADQAFRQCTVAGPDIVTADVLATAILAGGRSALHQLTARYGVQVLAVTATGDLFATPAFRSLPKAQQDTAKTPASDS